MRPHPPAPSPVALPSTGRGGGLRLALVGHGKMGRLVGELAPAHGFEVVLRLDSASNPGGAGITEEAFRNVDVAVDFSVPGAVATNAERLAALRVPTVVGTTGWLGELPRVREAVEKHGSALVWGANFSLGVQVFTEVVALAARLLAGETGYDAWAWEIHHKMKKDAPSGTLLHLVRAMEGAGWTRRIDQASNRAGAVPGTHVVGFDSDADTITLEHTARSRGGFATRRPAGRPVDRRPPRLPRFQGRLERDPLEERHVHRLRHRARHPFPPGPLARRGDAAPLVRRQIEEGIHFLVPCGTTGENPTLTRAEHLRVVEITLEEAKGKVPVLAGAGGYDTREVAHSPASSRPWASTACSR